jgi:hypothetical protein
VLEQLVGAT